jgi:hypothetical protein
MTTPNLGLRELVPSQSQAHIPLNTTLRIIDGAVNIQVLGRATGPNSPATPGDRYIVAASPTDSWEGQEGNIALAVEGDAWVFLTPKDGWIAYDVGSSPDTFLVYRSTDSPPGWSEFDVGLGGPGAADEFGDPATGISIVDDFVIAQDGTASFSMSGWVGTLASSGTVAPIAGEAGRPGIMRLSTGGVSAAGAAGIRYGSLTASDAFAAVVGGGEIVLQASVRAPTAVAAGQEYRVLFGAANEVTGEPSVGIYFYTRSSDGVFQYVTRASAGSATTTVDSGGLVMGTGWTHLKIVINAAGTSVGFYVDGVLKHTETLTIPSGTFTFAFQIAKTVGTSARFLEVDLFRFTQLFTTARWT